MSDLSELREAKAPVDVLLGDPSKCRRFTDDVAIHWYPTLTSETCWCGEMNKNPAVLDARRSLDQELTDGETP